MLGANFRQNYLLRTVIFAIFSSLIICAVCWFLQTLFINIWLLNVLSINIYKLLTSVEGGGGIGPELIRRLLANLFMYIFDNFFINTVLEYILSIQLFSMCLVHFVISQQEIIIALSSYINFLKEQNYVSFIKHFIYVMALIVLRKMYFLRNI